MGNTATALIFVILATYGASARAENAYKSPSSEVQYLHYFKGYIYFTAVGGNEGKELWRADPDTKAIALVADVTKGPMGSTIDQIIGFGDTLWFRVLDARSNGELWKSDGNPGGTTEMVWNENPSEHDAGVSRIFCEINGLLIFTTGIKQNTKTYRKYDIRDKKCSPLEDTEGQPILSLSEDFVIHEGELYFGGRDVRQGKGLWRSDGTREGTHFSPGFKSDPTVTADLGKAGVLFVGETKELGNELWITQGTPESTRLLKDIYPGPEPSSPDQFCSNVYGQEGGRPLAYFAATDIDHGRELWRSDGTEEGTVLAQDIVSGAIGSEPFNLRSGRDTLYLIATTPQTGSEIWAAEINDQGFRPLEMVGEGMPGPESSAPYSMCLDGGGTLYYSQDSKEGEELWVTSATPGTARMLLDINPDGDSEPFSPIFANGSIFFTAYSPTKGRELWRTQGSVAPPILFADILTDNSKNPSSSPSEMAMLGNVLLFAANDIENGNELWKSDGTREGTTLLLDIAHGEPSSNPSQITVVGSRAYFRAETVTQGVELWATDGTSGGTARAADITGNATGSSPDHLTAFKDMLLFSAYAPNSGRELWSVQAGKRPDSLKDICDGKQSSNPRNFTVWKDFVYFQADDGVHGEELWRTDGTKEGTVMVRDIVAVPYERTVIFELRPAGSRLYLSASGGGRGRELWQMQENGELSLVRDIASPEIFDVRAKTP